MGNVSIKILNDDPTYFALLTTLDISSPIDLLKSIENTFKCSGKILVDNILHSGNNSDRFLEFQCKDGKIDYNSPNYVQIERKSELRVMANSTLREYPYILWNTRF
ncbi:type II toxin-antitoxin system RnlB family antitoxin [Bacillus sp. FSL K6-3431]|uniref:type II toxin-antitoxin system RnlB family antitoxin n=1 Tax=Bacillus sp. FSL K6-3431 TaxID=2921500 RepID=UPI004046C5B0